MALGNGVFEWEDGEKGGKGEGKGGGPWGLVLLKVLCLLFYSVFL